MVSERTYITSPFVTCCNGKWLERRNKIIIVKSTYGTSGMSLVVDNDNGEKPKSDNK